MPRSEFLINSNKSGSDDVARWIDRLLKETVNGAMRAMRKAAELSRNEVIKELDDTSPYPPVDTGQGRSGFVVNDIDDFTVYLENTTTHMTYMEEGTRPHWAPFSVIEDWAERKMRGNKRGALKKGQKGPRMPRMSAAQKDAEVKKLAARAWISIARKGTAPRHFWKRASTKFLGFVEQALRAEIDKLDGL